MTCTFRAHASPGLCFLYFLCLCSMHASVRTNGRNRLGAQGGGAVPLTDHSSKSRGHLHTNSATLHLRTELAALTLTLRAQYIYRYKCMCVCLCNTHGDAVSKENASYISRAFVCVIERVRSHKLIRLHNASANKCLLAYLPQEQGDRRQGTWRRRPHTGEAYK